MLKGIVNQYHEPVIPITLKLKKVSRTYYAIIDTGFNGFLSVPESIIQKTNWTELGQEEYEIASGERMRAMVYESTVRFDGRTLRIPIIASHSIDILIGTRLMQGKILKIDFKEKVVKVRDA